MALHLQFASLSLGAAIDQQTGNLSVFEIVEEVRTPQVPIQIQTLVISLSLFRTDPHEGGDQLTIDLIPPDGKVARVGQGDLALPPDQRRLKAVFRFANFPVLQFGIYRFIVSWADAKGSKQGEAVLDFEVSQLQQQQGGPAKPGITPGGSVRH